MLGAIWMVKYFQLSYSANWFVKLTLAVIWRNLVGDIDPSCHLTLGQFAAVILTSHDLILRLNHEGNVIHQGRKNVKIVLPFNLRK